MPLPRILIADDDQDDLDLILSVFNDLDLHYDVMHAQNGVQLIEMLNKEVVLPDLILLDINMPKMDGLQALEIIRAKPLLASVPIIICSTSSADELKEKCLQLGADGFVTKECSMNRIQLFVRRLSAFLDKKGEVPGKLNSLKKIKPSKRNLLH